MGSSGDRPRRSIVVDSIHGDIELNDLERRIIDTASFQRLRHLKQLQMGHVTYPNATHTRFAHSIGVLGIMQHVARAAEGPLHLNDEDKQNIRLAGLLHDVGHYPYSHLLEGIDGVVLTDEFVARDKKPKVQLVTPKYPDHEELGELIITEQRDICDAIGGKDRAARIAGLFRGTTDTGSQLGRLIHSSLDMDRLDYLQRDAHATGVPYGAVDLNYIVNNLRVSPDGVVGVDYKALAAAEHALLARFFMHKTVYFHKTTYGIEEALRQLLRRIRGVRGCGLPKDGGAVREIARTPKKLVGFTDALVDTEVAHAATNRNRIIAGLAQAVLKRQPPKLLKEVAVLHPASGHQADYHAGSTFKQNCQSRLVPLAKKFKIPVEHFLYCETKPLKFEKRPSKLEKEELAILSKSENEIVQIFPPDGDKPQSIMDVNHSLIHHLSNFAYRIHRLYVVYGGGDRDAIADALRGEVKAWHLGTQ